MERCQPLVVFGVNPGSLGGRREEKWSISGKISHSACRKLQENDIGNVFVLFLVMFFGNQVLHHPWLENIPLPRLSFRHRLGVKIALRLHLSLALHLIKRSHAPVHATLVLARRGTTS